MPRAKPTPPEEVSSPLEIITITYDHDEGVVRLDIGDLDPWSAHSLLEGATQEMFEHLPPVTLVGSEDEEEEIDT